MPPRLTLGRWTAPAIESPARQTPSGARDRHPAVVAEFTGRNSDQYAR
jgi:hypothetical protein